MASNDLDLANASRVRHTRLGRSGRARAGDILALEVGEEGRVLCAVPSAAAKGVELAVVAQVRGARRVAGGVWAVEHLAREAARLDLGDDILEHGALDYYHRAGVHLERVARVGVPVVVDCVEEGVAADLWGPPRGVVDVVALEGDEVVGAGEVEAPVVVTVAGGRPRGRAIYLGVGDGDTVGSLVTQHYVLTANERGLFAGHLASLSSSYLLSNPSTLFTACKS